MAITNANLIGTTIIIGTDVEIGEIIGQMVGGANVRVPVHVMSPMSSSEKSQRRGRVNLIGVVEAMITLISSVTRFEADLVEGLVE